MCLSFRYTTQRIRRRTAKASKRSSSFPTMHVPDATRAVGHDLLCVWYCQYVCVCGHDGRQVGHGVCGTVDINLQLILFIRCATCLPPFHLQAPSNDSASPRHSACQTHCAGCPNCHRSQTVGMRMWCRAQRVVRVQANEGMWRSAHRAEQV